MDNHVRQAKGMLVLLTKLPVLVILVIFAMHLSLIMLSVLVILVMFAILHLILIMLLQGLIKGVREYFPDAEHRHCVRHIWQNFQNIHKGDVLRTNYGSVQEATHLRPGMQTWNNSSPWT